MQGGADLLLYDIEDFGGGEPLSSRVERIVGDGEAEAEVLVGGFLYLVAAVPEHYLLGLCLVEPAASTVAQELQRLGEELTVVGHTTGVDGRRKLDADETAVAGRIGEDVGHIARGDERRLARQFLDVRAIRSFRLYRGQLDNVLKKALLHTRRYLVELVEVDEQLLRHGEHHLTAVGKGKTVGVAPLQGVGQQATAKRTLVVALRRDEQRRNAVAVESRGLVLPLGDHGEQPRLEPLVP